MSAICRRLGGVCQSYVSTVRGVSVLYQPYEDTVLVCVSRVSALCVGVSVLCQLYDDIMQAGVSTVTMDGGQSRNHKMRLRQQFLKKYLPRGRSSPLETPSEYSDILYRL